MKIARRLPVGIAVASLVSVGCGITHARAALSVGELAIHVTLKGDGDSSRPLADADFDLTCTTPVAFSARLRTDADGRATTYAHPGKCLLKSRAPVPSNGKGYTWRGIVEFFAAQQTRLELSDDDATVQEGEFSRAAGERLDPVLPTADDVLPEIVHKVEPQYPAAAMKDRIEGKVVCQAVVGEDGHVRDVKVLSSTNPLFNNPAIVAISQWRYLPAQRFGQAVALYYTIRVDFHMR